MATSAVSSAGGQFVPSLENHFGCSFVPDMLEVPGPDLNGNTFNYITVWRNPHIDRAITPYIPSEQDEAFQATSLLRLNDMYYDRESISSAESFFLHHDVVVISLGELDLKSVIVFSEVNKCFYLAAKQDIVWQAQLSNLLPGVIPIAPNLCIFSPKQQFQILYKKIKDESKVYHTESDHLRTRGPFNQGRGKLNEIDNPGLYKSLKESGDRYLKQLDNIVKVLIPNAFNNQTKFEEVIRQAEVIKNTASSSSTVTVEDVTDVTEPTEKGV